VAHCFGGTLSATCEKTVGKAAFGESDVQEMQYLFETRLSGLGKGWH